MISDGSLVEIRRCGSRGFAQGKPFTKRYMDAQDYEMQAHGMGEYAGTYAAAVNVLCEKTGMIRSYKLSDVKEIA
ncbi:MAG: hypothetical protein H8E12_11275 [Rhodobacteraceae bacterium]|nr:hypothetical protein [Paracoccaceae bacterium]